MRTETIKMGGKERPVKFNINALAEFNRLTGTNFAWLFQIAENPLIMDFNHVRYLAYCGLVEGCEINDQEIDFTVKEVGQWLNDDFAKFPDLVKGLQNVIVDLNNAEEGTKKKAK